MFNMLVYLATPYTKGDVAVNVHNAIKLAEQVVELGHTPYVPVWTHFWHLISPHPWEYWMKIDEVIMLKCDCVLRGEGKSRGADLEVEKAQQRGIPVYFSFEELKGDNVAFATANEFTEKRNS